VCVAFPSLAHALTSLVALKSDCRVPHSAVLLREGVRSADVPRGVGSVGGGSGVCVCLPLSWLNVLVFAGAEEGVP